MLFYIKLLFISSLLFHQYLCQSELFKLFDDCDFNDCKKSSQANDDCLYPKQFTAREIESVKHYIQSRFAATHPVRRPCDTLRVSKEIKCLSKQELSELVAAFKALYAKGVMDYYSLIHGTFWPSAHKFAELFQWHRWHVHRIDQELRQINPNVTLPYWDYANDFSAPEMSAIWSTFGTSGNRQNDYCVTDGPFAYQTVQNPRPHCLKRAWNANGTIPVWEPPEWLTTIIQTSTTYQQFISRVGMAAHFKIHLHAGGFRGDLSDIWATNDAFFYPFHAHLADLALLRWQLADDRNLVPQTYNLLQKYDWRTGRVSQANIETDRLTHYEDISIKETFQVGFGELCHIHDQNVQPILDILANRRPKLPAGALTLQRQLPAHIFQYYFPKFASKRGTHFEHFMPDLRKTRKYNKFTPVCDEMPVALSFNSTPTGRRLLEQFRTYAGVDTRPRAWDAENQYYMFMNVLNKYRYCSQYLQTKAQPFM